MVNFTFPHNVEATFAKSNATEFSSRGSKAELFSIVEFRHKYPIIGSATTVHVKFYFGLYLGGEGVAPPDEIKCGDWRVMADLLRIHGAAVDPRLEGLPDDWIEGFLYPQVEQRVSESKDCNFLELLKRICGEGGRLQQQWGVAH